MESGGGEPVRRGPIADPFAHMHPTLRKLIVLVKPPPGESPYPGMCGLCCRISKNLCCPFDRASPFFLFHTVFYNLPPGLAATVIAVAHLSNTACTRNLTMYLLVTVVAFNAAAIGFAVRIYFFAFNSFNPLGAGQGQRGALKRAFVPNICQRAFLLCRDPLACLFVLWVPLALAWSVVGMLWAAQSAQGDDEGHPSDCPRSLKTMAVISAAALAVYLLTTLMYLSCTCMCELTGWAAAFLNPGKAAVTGLRLHEALQGTAASSAGPGLGQPLNPPDEENPPPVAAAAACSEAAEVDAVGLRGHLLYPQRLGSRKSGYEAFSPADFAPTAPPEPYEAPSAPSADWVGSSQQTRTAKGRSQKGLEPPV